MTFDPQSGHEQKGRRPALIVSNSSFNTHLGLAYACPITNTKRDFPFHVALQSKQLTGFIMVEQLKSIDYKSRKVKFIEKASPETMEEVMAIVESILS